MTRQVEITRPDKLLWPALEITKQRYVDYLAAVSDRILPWLRERPLTLVRAPDGVAGELANLPFAMATAVLAGIPRERILNDRPVEEVLTWARGLRER